MSVELSGEAAALELTSSGVDEGTILHPLNGVDQFLIEDGKRRHIPDPDTYRNLFGNAESLAAVNVDTIPLGEAFSSGAVLAKGSGDPAQFVISNGVKRHIVTQEAKDKYHFFGDVQDLPQEAINSIPTGPNYL